MLIVSRQDIIRSPPIRGAGGSLYTEIPLDDWRTLRRVRTEGGCSQPIPGENSTYTVICRVTPDGQWGNAVTGWGGRLFDRHPLSWWWDHLFPWTALTTDFITTTGTGVTWNVPSDWNSSGNNLYGIGTGAAGAKGGSGGGAGAFATIANVSLTPSGTTTYNLAATGTSTAPADTNFDSSTLVAKSGSSGTGGASSSCTPTTGAFSGGSGASTGGGGGAGGPNGAGKNGGATAGGGGGSDGGSSTAGTASGGAGGAGNGGSGGGAGSSSGNGTAGTAGTGGGGGGTTGSGKVAGAGATGISSWTATSGGATAGAGGGGGASGSGVSNTGGAGGLYGGGGGACSSTGAGAAPGDGAQGIIVATYTPSSGAVLHFLSLIGVGGLIIDQNPIVGRRRLILPTSIL